MWEISIIGVSHALFSLVVIMARPKKNRADIILCLWLFILSIPLLTEISTHLGSLEKVCQRLFNPATTLLHGPLLFLYINEVINNKKIQVLQYLLHLIPFLIFNILFQLNPTWAAPAPGAGLAAFSFFGVFNAAIFIFYSIITILILIRHDKNIKENFAYRNVNLTLKWLLFLPVIFFFCIIFLILWESSPTLSKLISPNILQLAGFLLFIMYLSFFGLQQNRIYKKDSGKIKELSSAESSNSKESEQLITQINKFMSTEKPYLEPKFSVYDLAASIGISRHNLSSLINNSLSKNFYQYVNEYRLDEVISRLETGKDDRVTIIEIAYDCGFNSKSSFNSLFKKKFGITPTQHRKSIKSE